MARSMLSPRQRFSWALSGLCPVPVSRTSGARIRNGHAALQLGRLNLKMFLCYICILFYLYIYIYHICIISSKLLWIHFQAHSTKSRSTVSAFRVRAEAQQRGEKGTAEILTALVEGLAIEDATPIYVVDLLGNRLAFDYIYICLAMCRYFEWARGAWLLQKSRLESGAGKDWRVTVFCDPAGTLQEESRSWMTGHILTVPWC